MGCCVLFRGHTVGRASWLVVVVKRPPPLQGLGFLFHNLIKRRSIGARDIAFKPNARGNCLDAPFRQVSEPYPLKEPIAQACRKRRYQKLQVDTAPN
jgi:hypothetical protein